MQSGSRRGASTHQRTPPQDAQGDLCFSLLESAMWLEDMADWRADKQTGLST